jgi:hypothetical protein
MTKKPKLAFPKYPFTYSDRPKVGLGTSPTKPFKLAHILEAEIFFGFVQAGDVHAALIALKPLRKRLKRMARENPPIVELVDDTL